MPLAIGTQIGPYDIVGWLGAGGMGEVYRARDPRLGRDVALKLIAESLATDPTRLHRFEQEARAAGQLNHPNVLTVYDVGAHQGAPYVVSELLEGETLHSRLRGGALAIRRVIDYARQTAEGLAAAHDKGIVHRDLKPDNLFVTSEGRVKILDFGLAKLTQPTDETARQTGFPTETEPGIVLGTAGYMSPEQVRGEVVDPRSDIFSVGTILYEMMAGRPAFVRETPAETMAAILKEDPPDLPVDNVPPALLRIIVHCLEKTREARFQSARDLVFDLESLIGASGPAVTAEPVPVRHRRWIGPLLAAIVGLLVATAATLWFLDQSEYFWRNPLANARFTLFTDFEGIEYDAAISADGRFVAFVSDRDGTDDIWVSQVGSGEFHNLTKGRVAELRGAANQSVGFSRDGSLVWLRNPPGNPAACPGQNTIWVVPTLGGALRPLLECAANVDWSPDGTRLVYSAPTSGDPMFVTKPHEKVGQRIFLGRPGVHSHFPTWSLDGRFIYFVHGMLPDEMDIWRIRPSGGDPEQVTFHHSLVRSPTLLNNRTLLYITRAEDGSGPWLYGVDVERRVSRRISFGVEQYSSIAASGDGRRLVATVATSKASLWRIPISDTVVDEAGAARVEVPHVRASSPRVGPNYLLYRSSKGGADGLWKLQDGAATELWNGLDGIVSAAPTVSSDGQRIAFPVRKGGRTTLYLMRADGTGARRITEDLDVNGAPSWSPDGKWIAVAAGPGSNARLFKIPVDGSPPVRLTDDYSVAPSWSPDGRYIVFAGPNVGSTFALKAVTEDGKPRALPTLVAVRGSQVRFVPGRNALVVVKGQIFHRNFYLVDLDTGHERQLTNLQPELAIQDFDVSRDGGEVLFARVKETSDIVLIDVPEP